MSRFAAKSRSLCPPLRDRKFADSSLEGNGFELVVPRHESRGFPEHPQVPGLDRVTLRDRKFADSSLEGAGFEPSVPRPIFNGFEAWSELEPIDPKRGGSAEKLRPDQPIGSEGGHSGAGAHAESGGPTEGSRALGDASSEESARTGTPGVAIRPLT